jgi:hypothetical protein
MPEMRAVGISVTTCRQKPRGYEGNMAAITGLPHFVMPWLTQQNFLIVSVGQKWRSLNCHEVHALPKRFQELVPLPHC